jgi:predicted nucleic acid-binding Zn ribbon protein
MPTYEYRCEANGRTVEVSHKMAELMHTWGELCERAGIAPGRTDRNAPVSKLMSAGFISMGSSSSAMTCPVTGSEAPACGNSACGAGFCAGSDN